MSQKTNCHSELVSESIKNKEYHTAGSSGRADACPRMTRESGRSMVEMLGVLAVIGVLSVAGIAGYSNAMKKHRANEILNEASKRAVIVAAQAIIGKTGEISLSEFTQNTVSGVTFDGTATVANNKITLGLSGTGLADICDQLKNATGDNTVMKVTQNDCSELTFNADLSSEGSESSGATCTETPTGCQACVGGELVDDDSKCAANRVCVDGTCSPNDLTGNGQCAKNSDCESVAACTAGKCFCNFSGNVNSSTGPTGKNGTCTNVSSFTKSENLAGFVWGDYTDWFSAKNFCAALPGNKRMAAFSDFNCPYTLTEYDTQQSAYCCLSKGSSIKNECPLDGWNSKFEEIRNTIEEYFWLKDLSSNYLGSDICINTGTGEISANCMLNEEAYILCK